MTRHTKGKESTLAKAPLSKSNPFLLQIEQARLYDSLDDNDRIMPVVRFFSCSCELGSHDGGLKTVVVVSNLIVSDLLSSTVDWALGIVQLCCRPHGDSARIPIALVFHERRPI